MATTTAAPTLSSSSGIDTISGATGIDTIAKFSYGIDLSIDSVYLPYARELQTSTPSSLFKTIDADGSTTNYYGNFIRSSNSAIATGSKITSFDGSDSKGNVYFSFASSKGFNAVELNQAVQSNNKVNFFNILLSGNDSLIGSAQDDVLGGYGGNDTIDGGLGKDKVFFSGNSADYKITLDSNASNFTTVQNIKTSEVDRLTNVELLQFVETTISVPTFSANFLKSATVNIVKNGVTVTFSSAFDMFSANSSSSGANSFSTIFSGNDVINGSFDNDILSGFGGNDTIYGGGGVDTVFFSGNYSDYKITSVSGVVTVTHIQTNETDVLTGISALQFVDRTIPTPTETPVITLPKVSVSAKQTAVTEGANLVYTVSLDKAATSDLKIPYKLSGRATSADYTGATGFVTIPKGSTTADISLLTKDDGIAETGGETVILTLGATTEATIAKSSATARINDKVVPVTTGNEITITASAASVSNTSKVNATNVTTAGDDKITSSVANLANVTIDGGAGNDTLTLSDSGNFSIAESFELGLGLAVKNIEKLQLANGNNEVSIVFNTPGIFEINGGNGNDTISTLFSPKSNIINGGEGNDTILILGNNDTVTGGSGKDIFLIMSTSSSGSISKGTFTDFTSATDKFDFSAIKIPVSTTTSSNSSIVGAWKATTPFGDAVATFMSDGTYFYADPNGGAERGTYSWDSTKSSFSVTGNTFDTSNLGFNPSSTPTVVAFNGTSASWTVQGQKITASPIIDATKSIVGSWHGKELGQAGGDNVFTFLSDGTYYMVDNGDPALDPSGKKGMEKGTYTWDSTTGKLTTTTTVNTNGQWGFSDNAASGTTVTAKVTGDTLLVTFTSPDGSGSGTLTKVISPTTSAPTTTTSMVNASVSFLGNKADFAQAQAAITANSDKLQVVYEQDKNILWADVNNDGVLNASDLQITLNGVNTLSAADFV